MRNSITALFKKHNQGDDTASSEKSGVYSWHGRGKKLVHMFSTRTWMEEITWRNRCRCVDNIKADLKEIMWLLIN
jgi:hypothetical protein